MAIQSAFFVLKTARPPKKAKKRGNRLESSVKATEQSRADSAWTLSDIKLPFQRQPTDGKEFRPRYVRMKLRAQVKVKMDKLAAAYHVSAQDLFLTSWQTLVFLLTKRSDFMLGVACIHSTSEESVEENGRFISYAPLLCQVQENTPFSELIASTRQALSIETKEDSDFAPDIKAPDNDSTQQSFPLNFLFLQADMRRASTESPEGEMGVYPNTRFHLTLVCESSREAFVTTIHYDSNLFEAKEVERMLGHLHVLLQSVIAHPEAPVGALNILNEAERHKLLVEFNQTKSDYPEGKCIHQFIEEQAERTPDDTAIVFQQQQLTYAEFNARANQLASRLRKLGVGPDVMVGICVQPSLEMMVGVLGILKAGGAYVPLDPGYPQERLAFIIEDTKAPVLLTQKSIVDESRLPVGQSQLKILCLDSDWHTIAEESRENPSSEVTDQNLVYVIYTSGSTGKPKGVLITHKNLVHSTYARLLYYRKPPGRYLLLSSFSFDSSVAGIFWPLIQGGALVLPEAGTQRDPRVVTDLIERHQITHTLCLASHYTLILSEANKRKLATLRTAIVSGEVFSMALVNRHDQLAPKAELFNEYGPTEASVWCIVFDCHSSFSGNKVPIGRPIANTQVYLLNSYHQPVPVGVPGELYIGGDGIAKGYLNRPELTKEKFIPDPFSGKPEARLYKTGDMARYLPDGNIEFLGRVDDQVKIRGYRIELGEIEAVLGQHPAIQELIVTSREDTPGDKRLVAYVVLKGKTVSGTQELRAHVSQKLPDYMVPSAFVFLESLPRTPIGKVDLERLPAPDAKRHELDVRYSAPRNSVEEVLATIWAQVLNLDHVGIEDNFFELGGHSILVIQIASRVRDIFKVELPLRDIFAKPTVSGLAESLRENSKHGAKIEKMADLLLQVERLSENEVEQLLDERA